MSTRFPHMDPPEPQNHFLGATHNAARMPVRFLRVIGNEIHGEFRNHAGNWIDGIWDLNGKDIDPKWKDGPYAYALVR